MKKTFVNVALLSMMAFAMPMTFTSCKDYGNDIDRLDTTTNGLTSQLSALQEAQTAADQIVAAAQKAAADALAVAQAAADKADNITEDEALQKAIQKAAEAAAAQAKKEAIDEAIAECKKLIADGTSDPDALSKLAGQVEGIETGLNKLEGTVDQAVKNITALQTQVNALETYKALLAQLQTEYPKLKQDVATLTTNINTITGQLTTLEKKVNEDITNQLKDLSEQISIDINNGANTLAGVLGNRLTSVTLMPDLYVGGIPTIQFKSAAYNPLKLVNGKWTAQSNTVTISNNSTKIQYRVSPGTIKTEDLDVQNMAFLSRVATVRTRAAEQPNDLINVVSAEVTANGVLEVTAGKSTTGSLNRPEANKINTVSLKVPVAKKHLFKEESAFSVYSEYTRLEEVTFEPKLHKTALVDSKIPVDFSDSATIYKSGAKDLIAYQLCYKNTLDLNTLVQGCEFIAPDTHETVSLEDFKAYGLEVRFAKATAPYLSQGADKANQQEFAQISGSTLTPVSPKGTTGYEAHNQAAIGKEPIIHVYLIDTKNGNNVVDSRYFKILYTQTPIETLTYNVNDFTSNLACGPYNYAVTWEMMTRNALSQFPNGGISKEEFYNRYKDVAPEITVDPAIGADNSALASSVSYNINPTSDGVSIPVIGFTLTNAQIGKLEQTKSKKYTVSLKFHDARGLTEDVVIKFTVTITNNLATPTLGETDPLKWKNETMLFYPVPYGTVVDGQKVTVANYVVNVCEGRIINANSGLVNGLIPCGRWNMGLATSYGGTTLAYETGFAGWKTLDQAKQIKKIEVTVGPKIHDTTAPSAAALATVDAATKIQLNWNALLNGIAANEVTFGTSYLQIVKPLKNPELVSTEHLTDNSSVQTIENLDTKLTLHDAYNQLVANTSGMPKNLWDYYEVEAPVFANTAGAIMVTSDTNGSSPRTLASLNMSADIDLSTYTLTFSSNGSPIQADAYLQIPVSIKHRWGTLTGKLYIKINHVLSSKRGR